MEQRLNRDLSPQASKRVMEKKAVAAVMQRKRLEAKSPHGTHNLSGGDWEPKQAGISWLPPLLITGTESSCTFWGGS